MIPADGTVRTLTPAEVGTLVEWAAAEGWNPGLADAEAFRAADPGGFIGAFRGPEMYAGISAIAYGASYGFIGLYICRPDMRGNGWGRSVWAAAMARLKGRTIGLDGVDEQLANYRSKGFTQAYRTIRFGGRLDGGTSSSIRDIAPELLPGVIDFDRRGFPAPREAFLRRWLAAPHRAVAYLENGRIAGYGVARQCREGFKVGGLIAESDVEAVALLRSLAASLPGILYIDVPAHRRSFIDELRAAGLTPGFETTRMYHGPAPSPARSLYGVTSLELG
jgi:hypothetical protein